MLHHAVLSDDAETVPWASSTRRLSLTMSWTWAAENFEKYRSQVVVSKMFIFSP